MLRCIINIQGVCIEMLKTDIVLNYVQHGYGEPLILLHGNGENVEYFNKQIKYFKQNYCVIAIDTRGHGKSPRGDAPFTISQFADDLEQFMSFKNIDKAHILGFSDGGNIALVFALKYPARVSKLILNGANINAKGVKLRYQIPIVIGYSVAKLFARYSTDALRNAELLALMVNEPKIAVERLKDIKSETLVIVGNRDMIKVKHSYAIAYTIPNAQLVTIKGDHFIAAKRPNEFNEAINKFLQNSQ